MVPAIQEPTAQGGTELLSRCYLQYSVKDLALAWTMTRAGSREWRALLGTGGGKFRKLLAELESCRGVFIGLWKE